MAELLLDYRFASGGTANADGSFPVALHNVTDTTGPSRSPLGRLRTGTALGASGRGQVDLTGLSIDTRRWCVRVIVRPQAAVTERANLVESNRLPFSVSLRPGSRPTNAHVVASVKPSGHAWGGPDTSFGTPIKIGRWATIDLVYDIDTAALFVNGKCVSVHAFPKGRIDLGRQQGLFFGTWVDGRRNHFDGDIAAFQLWKGTPEDLERALDERRDSAEWYITYKRNQTTVNLGKRTKKLSRDRSAGAWVQHYERGEIHYRDGMGAAFEMHGTIQQRYRRSSGLRQNLGYLVSDEMDGAADNSRKSLFEKGGIYWSGATGAQSVRGQLYLSYETLGEGAHAIGLPTGSQRSIGGGLEQVFAHGRMFHRRGTPTAFEVHGSILAHFLATGGTRVWGFPVSDESVIRKDGADIGRSSDFEGCTIYWSGATGAHEVHGHIRERYLELGGPAGELGLPTSDELDIPGHSGPGRMSGFQGGSLLWYGSKDSIVFARPFKLFVGRLSTREDEGFGMGQNDLYCRIQVFEGSQRRYNKRLPSRGDWDGNNTKDVNHTVPIVLTPRPGVTFTLLVDVWDSDGGAPFGGGDDHLGKWTKVLNAANAWGLRDNDGILNSGSFSKIRSITAAVQPVVDVSSLTDVQKWWSVENRGTPSVSYPQYGAAFSDVDDNREWWDVTDWLELGFYDLVVRELPSGGNCFGMSLEGIYARKGRSLFSMPLDRFSNWNTLRSEFNIKHLYQVGAQPIWWFLGQLASGNTHDPKDVFVRSRARFQRGEDPVICISQNWDFSGAPHCVLPIGWETSHKPWEMSILDPNHPGETKTITVDPDANTYEYVSSSSRRYQGGQWSGGRLHYMPFTVLNRPPRTPIWDAILLLLAGTILIVGEDAETSGIVDGQGADLDGHGDRAKRLLQAGTNLDGFFMDFKGFDGSRIVPGQLLMRRGEPPVAEAVSAQPRRVGATGGTIRELGTGTAGLRSLADLLRSEPASARLVRDRNVHRVLADPSLVASLGPSIVSRLVELAKTDARAFKHSIRGRRNGGQFRYLAKHGLSELRIASSISTGQTRTIEASHLGTEKSRISLEASVSTAHSLTYEHKLGIGGDRVKMTFSNLPVGEQGRPVELNLRPGLGGIDIASPGMRQPIDLAVEARVSGRTTRRRYRVDAEDGFRLRTSNVISDGDLAILRIDRVFGPALRSSVIGEIGNR